MSGWKVKSRDRLDRRIEVMISRPSDWLPYILVCGKVEDVAEVERIASAIEKALAASSEGEASA